MGDINPDDIERTKQQIRGLVNEIANLAKAELTAEDYYSGFLQRVVQALAAVGGAIWLVGEGRRLGLQYQISLQSSLTDPNSPDANRHFRLLQQVLAERSPQLIPPMSGAAEDDGPGNPTPYLLLLAPLGDDEQPAGIVEVFQRPNSPPATQRGYLRFLLQMCEMASEWIKTRKLKQFSDRHSLWAQADHFSRQVHDSLNVRETCYTITNEARRLIGCDRVSVAVQKGRRCVVEAISGQDTIESRSNVVYHLNDLASKVVATGESLWYSGSTENLPPQIEKAINGYVEESYSREIIVLPLRKPKTAEMRFDESTRAEAQMESNESNETFGALILEQIETDLPREIIEPRIDLVYEHSARALSNAVEHDRLFLMPVWRAVGKLGVVTKARHLPKTLTVAGILAAIGLAMGLWKVDFDLKATGSLQPVEQRDISAAAPGRIVEVLVKDQDEVIEGQPLARMTNPEYDAQLLQLQGERDTEQERYETNVRIRSNQTLSPTERRQQEQELTQLATRIGSLNEQIAELEARQQLLVVKAPIGGRVLLSWDVARSLQQRTVEPGQVLMTIADVDKEWEVELDMPERRMGHVMKAYQSSLGPKLPVRYVLATEPRQQFSGSIKEIEPVTRVEEKEGQIVRIRVAIDKQPHEKRAQDKGVIDLRPGATVTGRVHCGRATLGYYWFHEAWQWMQANLFF